MHPEAELATTSQMVHSQKKRRRSALESLPSLPWASVLALQGSASLCGKRLSHFPGTTDEYCGVHWILREADYIIRRLHL